MASNLGDTLSYIGRETGRSNLLYLTIILGIVVEELVARHHLCGRQDNGLLASLINTLRNFRTLQEALNHNLGTLQHSLADSRSQLVLAFHLADAKTGTVGSRFHEARHTDALLYLIIAYQFLIALTDEQRLCYTDTVAAQILVQHELIERHRLNQYATGRVRQSDEVKVTLQDTILARCTMNGDIGVVKEGGLAVYHEREIVAVNLGRQTVGQFNMPVLSLDINDIDVIALLVEEGVESLG